MKKQPRDAKGRFVKAGASGGTGGDAYVRVDKTKEALEEVRKICRGNFEAFAENMTDIAKTNTRNFKGHRNPDPDKRPQGNLIKHIDFEMVEPVGFKVFTDTGYGGYVELGTKHAAAQPYIGPAYEQSKQDFEEMKWDR